LDYVPFILLGGLDNAEMTAWYKSHSTIPEENRHFFSDMTGNIPLYLNNFQMGTDSFEDAWDKFTISVHVSALRTHIRTFTNMIMDPAMLRTHRKMMKSFIAELKQEDDYHHLYDHAGFYIENGVGRCVNGLARAYATSILLRDSPYIFAESEIINQIQATTNPSVKGFLVENAVLSFIKQDGFLCEGDRYCRPGKQTKVVPFSKGDEVATLKESSVEDITKELELLFIPHQWNYPSVDAVYRGHWLTQSKSQGFLIAGIQITLQDPTKQHVGSRDAFRRKVKVWKRNSGEAPSIWYIWISPARHEPISHDATTTRPRTTEIFLQFSEISPKLAFLNQ